MNELDVEEEIVDRVSESVRHALQLVGPAEGGAEHIWEDDPAAT